MSRRDPIPFTGTVRYLLAATAGGYLALYIVIALWRLQHPFELEWMEGAMVDHVQRIMDGGKIYVAPSLDFVPFLYPPGFYYASVMVAEITGVGFAALRLVSFLSSLGMFVLLHLFVVRETQNRFAGVIATGLFAATYSLGGSWLDVGRVDSLFLFILLSAFFVLRFHRTGAGHIAAGILIGLSFLTKQSAAVMAAPALLYVIWRDPRRGLLTAAVSGALMLGATLLIDGLHHGWYWFYVIDLPSGFEMRPQRLLDFWMTDTLPPLAIAWAVGLIYLLRREQGDSRSFYLAMSAGVITGAWVSRSHAGAASNVLIPVFLIASLLFGLGLHTAQVALARAGPGLRVRTESWLGIVCLLQLALLAYNPLAKVPSRADVRAGKELVRTLAAVDGDVWIPYHGFLTTMAGKSSHAHWMAISDILESQNDSLRASLLREINSAIRAQRFGLIVGSSRPFPNSPQLGKSYRKVGPAVADSKVLWPVTGSPRRVEMLYLPKPRVTPKR